MIFKSGIIKAKNKAAALLEFAFIVPVLLGLIYMAHDIPRTRHYKALIKADMSYAEQMLKSIGNTGSSVHKVTKNDIFAILKAIAVTHGYVCSSQLNYNICLSMTLIKGIGSNHFKPCWSGYSIFRRKASSVIKLTSGDNLARYRFLADDLILSDTFPNMTIKEGEYKIILEIGVNNYDSGSSPFKLMITEPRKVPSLHSVMLREISIFTVSSAHFNETFPS